jgi:hypothetical protein
MHDANGIKLERSGTGQAAESTSKAIRMSSKSTPKIRGWRVRRYVAKPFAAGQIGNAASRRRGVLADAAMAPPLRLLVPNVR